MPKTRSDMDSKSTRNKNVDAFFFEPQAPSPPSPPPLYVDARPHFQKDAGPYFFTPPSSPLQKVR